ncbi:ATP phosphoribosyltransferase regulatory subunit [Marinobacter fonticola]|uniref:ATP phosphoribosyltransferase regulatory subunit n=1 Tax=Marinobacter fonticola TaxID=2603215 RepID=UPI0011E77444|nr:ATP phosphoribosyltransferase regulatory subunit [Marinobacter fonticola]
MTASDRWLLPDGVEDILPPLAGKIDSLRREMMDTYQRWGYQLVIPPLIEYLESLFTGTGNDLALQTFKLTDQLTGRLMGVRADMTPQAARIDAHTLRQDSVTRLCYAGHVLHTRPHMLTGRTPIQAGCELFGSASALADQEVIRLMLETLRLAGIPKIHLDLAHVAIYQSLMSEADLDPQTEAEIFDAMRRKSIPELDALLSDRAAGSPAARLRELARLSGGAEVLNDARQVLAGATPQALKALDELTSVATVIAEAFPDVELGFDFCELRGYNYHTGLVFAAYAHGHGQAVAQGGRYDAIGRDFGRPRPATGFSADVRALVALGERTVPPRDGAIWAPVSDDVGLQARVADLRRTDTVLQALPDDSSMSPQARGCTRQLVKRDGQWVVESLNG